MNILAGLEILPFLQDYYYFRCAGIQLAAGNPIYTLQPMQSCLVQFGLPPTVPSLVFPVQGIWLLRLFSFGTVAENALLFIALSIVAFCLAVYRFCPFPRCSSKAIFILLLFIGFPPAFKALWYGQISLLLCSVFIFSIFIKNKSPVLTGVLYGFLLLKPQIFAPIVLLLVVTSPFGWSKRFILSLLGSLLAQVFISLSIHPNAFQDLGSSLSNFKRLQDFPSFFYFLPKNRLQIPINYFISAAASFGMIYFFFKRNRYKDPEVLGVVVSIFFAPYIWLHDLIYLLPAIFPYLLSLYARSPIQFGILMFVSFIGLPYIFAMDALGEGAYVFLTILVGLHIIYINRKSYSRT